MKAEHGSIPKTAGADLPQYNKQDYISTSGVRICYVGNEPMLHLDDLNRVIIEEASKLYKETHPTVAAAQDARKVVSELVQGLGGDMDVFRANATSYLNEIRQLRFAVVSETAQMTKELKDVRQFFLASDYKDQIERLKEFVSLCERLAALKKSGTLDAISDTILRLAV